MVIRSYRSKAVESLYRDLTPAKAHRSIAKQAIRRLQQLDAATSLRDLSLPGNRLERLSGDRKGQYSIRINEQWRICFRWEGGDAHDVEIVDYH
jgi:proteic killer suppression protein